MKEKLHGRVKRNVHSAWDMTHSLQVDLGRNDDNEDDRKHVLQRLNLIIERLTFARDNIVNDLAERPD